MADTYTFTKDDKGRALRAQVAASHRKAGRAVREFDDVVTFTIGNLGFTFEVLKLEVGRRTNEGQIAANMKERKP